MNNTGGLNKIFVCPISNLTSDSKVKSPDHLINIPFIPDTAERVCTRKEDKTGIYHELSIKCKIARSDKAESLVTSFPANYILITIDTNNVNRIEGNREEPLHHEYESKTGTDFSDLNHAELKFSRKLRLSPTILPD